MQISNLSFETRRQKILRDLSLEFPTGQLTVLLGPNGSGKTTLLRLVSGLIDVRLPKGSVTYGGQDLTAMEQPARSQIVTYLGSEARVDFPIQVRDLIGMGARAGGRASSEDYLQDVMTLCSCREFSERNVQALSGGERQRVFLAKALAQETPFVFLDESLSKVDLHHQIELGEMLRDLCRKGRTVVLVSHDVNFALSIADRVLVMRDGLLLKGEVQESLREIYPHPGLRFEVKREGKLGVRLSK